MKHLDLKNKKGFTLLEALVAVSILMVAVSAPITIAQKGLSSAVYSKDQMIASYLVQDAIEYIKNKRDEVSINDASFNWTKLWDSSESINLAPCVDSGGCQIDTINDNISTFDETKYLIKDADGFYQYNSGVEETRLTRKIEIKFNSTLPDEALVTVTVKWADNLVVVNTLIYNY